MEAENAETPLSLILLREILGLLRKSGANAVEQMGALQAASALVPVLKYRALSEYLPGESRGS